LETIIKKVNNVKDETINPSLSKEVRVSILTASLNEVNNIEIWLKGILALYNLKKLDSIKEIVIVDDGSTDGTVEKINAIKMDSSIPIKLVERSKKLGTLNAQIIGAANCGYEYVLVMDCDLQHPIELIQSFISKLNRDVDIIVGSRYMPGGFNNWPAYRGAVSRVATFLSHILLKKSRKISDPLSGYFVIKRSLLLALKPYTGMYKPLLYAIATSKKVKVVEIPVRMEGRSYGESKIVTNPIKFMLKFLREIVIFYINSKREDNTVYE